MAQLINYDDAAGTVMVHHTDPSLALGGGFEHAGAVALTALRMGVRPDGVTPEPFFVRARCPICGAIVLASVIGDEGAQRLVAKGWHALDHVPGTYLDAVAAVDAAIPAAGGVSRLNPARG